MSDVVKYRKKPIVIEAIQYFPAAFNIIRLFVGNATPLHRFGDDKLGVQTLEGMMVANPGDWIIKGIRGEFYPCKPDIFEATYEPLALKEWSLKEWYANGGNP